MNLKSKYIYYVSTALVAMNWGFGAISSLAGSEISLNVYRSLGYPAYFHFILGSAQALGIMALVLPVPKAIREWAYAGLTFDVLSAIISLLAIGAGFTQLVFPLIALAFLATSYFSWKSRSSI